MRLRDPSPEVLELEIWIGQERGYVGGFWLSPRTCFFARYEAIFQ